MMTKTRKYTTISIPDTFATLIPQLQKTYSQQKGVSVSRGETVGIAIKNESEKYLEQQ
jgi:hypothetical protein